VASCPAALLILVPGNVPVPVPSPGPLHVPVPAVAAELAVVF